MKNKIAFLVIALMVLIIVGFGVLYYYSFKYDQPLMPSVGEVVSVVVSDIEEVITGEAGVDNFASTEEFKAYLAEANAQFASGFFGGMGGVETRAMPEMAVDEARLGEVTGLGMGGEVEEPARVSETTVQVSGIDEPDIVKTDGKEIYYSRESNWYWYWDENAREANATKLIKALPPEEMKLDSEIDLTGDLLISEGTLVVISYEEIQAYDVTDPADPVELWKLEFEDAGYETARLYNGKIYLVTNTWVNQNNPCPFKPISVNGEAVSMDCADIYRPNTPVPADTTYDVMIIDPATGAVEDKVSFVASYGNSVIYISAENIYVTYSYPESFVDLMADFFEQDAFDLLSTAALQRIRNLKAYEISEQAKLVEFQVILEEYLASLDEDERLRIENEFQNRADDYMEEHKREVVTCGIAKIDMDDLSVDATGEVPGTPLNQFSLDEYDNHLRITVTIGSGWGWWGMMGADFESVNDLYVLDKNLNVTGSVLDMGEGERIYSTRLIADKGYMVTFRETDPFYVFDLSNPRKPQMTGELKIPGFSSYLHPIAEDRILGIGREDGSVKLSLFDVSDPEEPIEVDKYLLDEYWSDILNTHHAFLQDADHEIFFVPGGQGGYIFSYVDDRLVLERAVANIEAERAIYINDYLYIIGRDEIVVLDENTWEEIAEFEI